MLRSFSPATAVGLALLLSLVASNALFFLLQRSLILRRWMPSSFRIRPYFSISVFLLALILCLRASVPFLGLSDASEDKADTTLGILLILVSAWTLSRALRLARIVAYSRLDLKNANNLRERKLRTQLQFIEKLLLIFIYTVSVALVLMHFEGARRMGSSLIASAGVAGVALGFAAQRSLANLLAGFQIAFTQPIRIDDVVVVEGEWGRIEEITLTYVIVRLWDRRSLVVPINYFIEKPFQNWTRASADLLGAVRLHVDYTLPLDAVRAEFKRFLESSMLWDGHSASVQVVDSTEKAMEIRFLMSARDASDAFDLRCQVREHLIGFIQRSYPQCLPQLRSMASEGGRVQGHRAS